MKKYLILILFLIINTFVYAGVSVSNSGGVSEVDWLFINNPLDGEGLQYDSIVRRFTNQMLSVPTASISITANYALNSGQVSGVTFNITSASQNQRLIFDGTEFINEYPCFLTASDGAPTGSALYVDNNGNVGIRTSSPQSLLHINGAPGSVANGLAFGSNADTGIYENSDNQLRFIFAGLNSYTFTNSLLRTMATNGASMINEVPTSTNPVFSFNGDEDTGMGLVTLNAGSLIAGGINVLNFDSSGYVGIGTSAPTSELTIGGTSTITFLDGTAEIGGATLSITIDSPTTIIDQNLQIDDQVVYGIDTSNSAIVTANAVTPNSKYVIVESGGGAVVLASNPQIVDGIATYITELVLIGNSDTNRVTFIEGNGLSLNGGVNCTLGLGDTLYLIYYPTADIWREISRSDNDQ